MEQIPNQAIVKRRRRQARIAQPIPPTPIIPMNDGSGTGVDADDVDAVAEKVPETEAVKGTTVPLFSMLDGGLFELPA